MSFDSRYALHIAQTAWNTEGTRRKNKKKPCAHVRVEREGIAYYIRRDIYKHLEHGDTALEFMQSADYAINLATNELIKCRDDLDTIIGTYVKNAEGTK